MTRHSTLTAARVEVVLNQTAGLLAGADEASSALLEKLAPLVRGEVAVLRGQLARSEANPDALVDISDAADRLARRLSRSSEALCCAQVDTTPSCAQRRIA